MKKYLLKRIGFSIFSLIVVVTVVMLLVYTLINRNVIFQMDDVWNKRNNNSRTYYEYTMYQKYGYLNFVDFSTYLSSKYSAKYGEKYSEQADFKAARTAIQYENSYLENADVQEFIAKYEGEGYTIVYLTPMKYANGRTKPGGDGYLLATMEKSVFSRLWDYAKGLITVETINDVDDPNLTDRYTRWEKDPYSGLFAHVGSGTTHKYLLYFDGRFPFIHQNRFHLHLGVSFTKYRGQEIVDVITQPTGEMKYVVTQYPAYIGTDRYDETAINFHEVTYSTGETTDAQKGLFTDNYTNISYQRKGLSMIENSFVMGIIATILAYMLGLPLGVLNARKKDKLPDKIGMWYIIFIMAVPSLAYIFMFAAIGTRLFGLPYAFANAKTPILAYILPIISLALPSVGGLMKWMRRYMIDQMNSDYVKFARAEGLSESEIFSKHISRNAVIPIIHGIPGSILGCLVGAIITERVYAVPGVGNLLTAAINGHDNAIIVACTVFYTLLSIISLILGDILMAKWDPRISFESKGGR